MCPKFGFLRNRRNNKVLFFKKNIGEIISIKRPEDKKKRSKGIAYITYESPEEALSAVNRTNRSNFHGKLILVSFYKERKRKADNPKLRTDDNKGKKTPTNIEKKS